MKRERVSIVFVSNGGAGGMLIHANFIKAFHDYLQDENLKIAVVGHSSGDFNNAVFKKQLYIDEYFCASEKKKVIFYDVYVNLNFYPDVKFESDRVAIESPKLHRLLEEWRSFIQSDKIRQANIERPTDDLSTYVFGVVNGKNFVNIGDVGGLLGIEKDLRLPLHLHKGENDVLKKFNLENYVYITLQRGATPGLNMKELPKLWPLEYYNELIRLLKCIFPEYKIVQLGESKDRCGQMEGIDINLLEKTDWEDLKVLLKNAWLHIDGECGMVHMRRALKGGPSVVLFGPTPMEFYSYDENINIKADEGCKHWCARISDFWQYRCLKSDHPACMWQLTPQKVLERIMLHYILEQYKYKSNEVRVWDTLDQLISDNRVRIAPDYYQTMLKRFYCYHYELVKIKIKDLKVHVLTNSGFKLLPVWESPAYLYLKGDKENYESYVTRLQSANCDRMHSVERFCELKAEFEEKGYDASYKLLIDGDGRIRDGQHRASWLMHKYEEEYEIEACRIYFSEELFPFWKIEKGSKIVIYGYGNMGRKYEEQIKRSGYCNLLYIVDSNYDTYTVGYPPVYEPSVLKQEPMGYDYVVVSVKNDKNSQDIVRNLLDIGISQEKIISFIQ